MVTAPIKVNRTWIGAPARALGNPTMWLALLTPLPLALGTWAYLTGRWPAFAVVGLHAVAIYVGFTVLHESMHGVAHRLRWVNGVLGRLWAVPLLISYPLFRGAHYEHHSHTNDPERDPDLIVARSPRWLLPLWLLGPVVDYRIKFYGHRLWRTRSDLIESIATDIGVLAIIAAALATGTFGTLFVLWIAPALLAFIWLAFAFDFLPHYPYDSAARYYDTRIYPGRFLNLLLLGQNYHLIHHLWTTVPWYRYQQVFGTIRPELEARQARIGFGVTPLPRGAALAERG